MGEPSARHRDDPPCPRVWALTLVALLGCGARSSLGVGGGGASSDAAPTTGGSGGHTASSCEPPKSWLARTGSDADHESADDVHALSNCALLATGDVGEGIYLDKRDDQGEIVWSHTWGDGDGELARGIDVDAAGNIYLGAEVWGSIDLGGGPLVGQENWDVVLASFSADGSLRWSQIFAGADYQETADIATDPAGNTVVAAEVVGSIDFGGGPLIAAGSWDIALASFDSDGNHRWSRVYGDDDIQTAPRVAMRDDGSIWWAGWFSGTLPIDWTVLESSDDDDGYLALLSSDGELELVRQIEGQSTQRVLDVATAPDGVVLVGEFHNEIIVGSAGFVARGGSDAFAVRYDDGGSAIWIATFSGVAADATATAATVRSDGTVVVAGRFNGELEVNGALYDSPNRESIFIAELTPDGDVAAFDTHGTGNLQYVTAMDTFPDGSYALGGSFEATLTLGDATVVTDGGFDAFVGRVAR